MKKTISELWNDIFKDYKILEEIDKNNFFKITADEIRKYKEPRLMAKFDFSKQLPKIFKEHKLGILPIKNGEYIIGKFDLFERIPNYEDFPIKKVELPDFIETIDPDNIYSESNALNVAQLSGMLNDAFEEELFETIQGKMRTNNFNFIISTSSIDNKIEVNGAAIEIDGGYESKNKVVLIEAKNSMPEDFIIRQLYYPYRHWKEKVIKDIIPVFFAYENGIYNLFIYSFEDINKYNSLSIQKIKRYVIQNKDSESIKKEIFNNIEVINELSQQIVPFPQADSFTKVLGTLDLINSGINTAQKISEELEFDVRQGKYYIDALRYLEFVKKSNKFGEYELAPLGLSLFSLDIKSRNAAIIKQILQHKPFYNAYKYYLENSNISNKEYIKTVLKGMIPQMSDETINRRASTIKGWINWIIGCQV